MEVSNETGEGIYNFFAGQLDGDAGWSSKGGNLAEFLAPGESKTIPLPCGTYHVYFTTGSFGYCDASSVEACREMAIGGDWRERFYPRCPFQAAVINE